MIYTAAALLAGVGLTLIFRNRMIWVLLIAFVVRIMVPPVTVGMYFWKTHPTITMLIGAWGTLFVVNTPRFFAIHRRYRLAFVVATGLLAYGSLDYLGGLSGLSNTLNLLSQVIIVPLIIYALTRDAIAERPQDGRYVLWLVLGAAVVEVVLGQSQINSGEALVWQEAYRQSWWWTEPVTRAVGTLGHFLQVGVFMAMAAALLFGVRSVPLRLALAPVLLYGTIIGTARTGFVITLVLAVVLVLAAWRQPLVALWSTISVGLVAGLFYAANWERVDHLLQKFENDQNSTERRAEAVRFFTQHIGDYIFTGYQGPRDTKGAGMLNSSLENGYLAIAMTYGVLFGVLFTLFAVALAVAPLLRDARASGPAVLAAVVCLVGFASGNSLLSMGIEVMFMWLFAGLGAGLGDAASSRRVAATLQPGVDTKHPELPLWRQHARGLV